MSVPTQSPLREWIVKAHPFGEDSTYEVTVWARECAEALQKAGAVKRALDIKRLQQEREEVGRG